jgi:hypothetical protein
MSLLPVYLQRMCSISNNHHSLRWSSEPSSMAIHQSWLAPMQAPRLLKVRRSLILGWLVSHVKGLRAAVDRTRNVPFRYWRAGLSISLVPTAFASTCTDRRRKRTGTYSFCQPSSCRSGQNRTDSTKEADREGTEPPCQYELPSSLRDMAPATLYSVTPSEVLGVSSVPLYLRGVKALNDTAKALNIVMSAQGGS